MGPRGGSDEKNAVSWLRNTKKGIVLDSFEERKLWRIRRKEPPFCACRGHGIATRKRKKAYLSGRGEWEIWVGVMT